MICTEVEKKEVSLIMSCLLRHARFLERKLSNELASGVRGGKELGTMG